MNASILEQYDWRKHAEETVSRDDVELAFYRQAMTTAANQCGDLMSPRHHLGFEIVEKNDDSTRLIGIFAFRSGREIYYVPVFFINGQIKGGEFIINKRTGKFKALSRRRVAQIINEADVPSGDLVKRNPIENPTKIDLNLLAHPPGNMKIAAVFDSEPGSETSAVLAENPWLAEKLAGAIERDYDFADAVYRMLPALNFSPKTVKKPVVKSASLYRFYADPFSKEAREAGAGVDDLVKGFYIKGPDFREAEPESIECIKPGKGGKILFDDGFKFAALFKVKDLSSIDPDCSYVKCDLYEKKYAIVCVNNKSAFVDMPESGVAAVSSTVEDAWKCKNTDGKFNGPGWYALLLDNGTAIAPLYIVSKESLDGVDTYQVDYNGNSKKLRINNESSKNCLDAATFSGEKTVLCKLVTSTKDDHYEPYISEFELAKAGSKNGFLPVSFDTAVNDMAFPTRKAATAEVISIGGIYEVHCGGKKLADCLSRKELEIGLCACGLGVKEASALADKGGKFDWPRKQAVAWPDVDQITASGEFPVQVQSPSSAVVDASDGWRGSVPRREIPVGEMVDPSMGRSKTPNFMSDEILLVEDPMRIAQIAREAGLPQVFDHAVAGALARASGLDTMIEKHLPRLEEAEDSLGRLLFVLYWRPQEFEQAFGLNDMRGMENRLKSLLKSIGELSMDLEDRSDKAFA